MEQFLYNLTHGYGYIFTDFGDMTECFKYLIENNITWHTGAQICLDDAVIEYIKKYMINSNEYHIYYDGYGICIRNGKDINAYTKDYVNGIITYNANEYAVDLI